LTAVHEAILEDLVYPAEIVGKRIRIKLDGSKITKVHLDKNQQTNVEHKVNLSLNQNCFSIRKKIILVWICPLTKLCVFARWIPSRPSTRG
jgi:hypothetical protein